MNKAQNAEAAAAPQNEKKFSIFNPYVEPSKDYKDIVKPSVSDNVKLLYGMPARTNSSGMKQNKLAPSFVGKTTEEEQQAQFQQRVQTILNASSGKVVRRAEFNQTFTSSFPAKGLGLLRQKYDSESVHNVEHIASLMQSVKTKVSSSVVASPSQRTGRKTYFNSFFNTTQQGFSETQSPSKQKTIFASFKQSLDQRPLTTLKSHLKLSEELNKQREASASAVDRAYQSTKSALQTNQTSISQAFKFEAEQFNSPTPVSRLHQPYSVLDMSRTLGSSQMRRALDNTTSNRNMQQVLESITKKPSRTVRTNDHMLALINQNRAASSKIPGNKHIDPLSIMSWASSQQKLDLMNKTSPSNKRFTFSSSIQSDPKDLYQTFRNTKYKQPPTISGVQGFGDFIHNVDNEVHPWITTPEFEGAFQDGMKNGAGRMVYPNGDIYKGNFNRDMRNGAGTMIFKDGRVFKGQFINDQIKGKGIFKVSPTADSIIIEAVFDGLVVHPGPAKIQYPSGEVYDGRINMQGQRDGNGKLYYANGDLYEGQWHNDKRNGKGKLSFGDRGSFTGTFKDDEAYDGKLIDRYENSFENDTIKGGYFLHGKLTGFGKAKFTNQNDYIGEFRDGMMSGQGVLTYKEGFNGTKAVYTGHFRANKRDGYGEIVWGNAKTGPNGQIEGEMFKGIWHNDQKVNGVIKMQDGTEYDGEWMNDNMHGQGKLTFKPEKKGEQGIIYEGKFVDGVQQTEGKLFYPNGDYYQGQTLDKNRQGRGVLTVAATGDIQDCIWEDNKKSGLGIIFYHASGNFFKGNFMDDKMDGYGTFYEASTKELYVGLFQNGLKHGEGFLIISVGSDSKKTGVIEWQEQYYEGQFKTGKMDGPGQVINSQPNLAKIMEKFGVDSDEWNSFESKFRISKRIVKTLKVRINNLTTSQKKVTQESK